MRGKINDKWKLKNYPKSLTPLQTLAMLPRENAFPLCPQLWSAHLFWSYSNFGKKQVLPL